MTPRLEDQYIEALFGQDARKYGPIQSAARDADIEGGKLLFRHASKMHIPCLEHE